ncbi:MAG: hypothetical protein IPL20_02265 [Saprospiraceae bacterium]|nr:hypothetical protein [Saprospiraceae bacterium]
MKTIFQVLFFLFVFSLQAQEPVFFLEFSNPKFENKELAFDIKIFPVNKNFKLLSGNIRYNLNENNDASADVAGFTPGGSELQTDAVAKICILNIAIIIFHLVH